MSDSGVDIINLVMLYNKKKKTNRSWNSIEDVHSERRPILSSYKEGEQENNKIVRAQFIYLFKEKV